MVDPHSLPRDAAVDAALDAIESAYGADPITGVNRLEHATMARLDQIERMKALRVEPSFIPDFLIPLWRRIPGSDIWFAPGRFHDSVGRRHRSGYPRSHCIPMHLRQACRSIRSVMYRPL